MPKVILEKCSNVFKKHQYVTKNNGKLKKLFYFLLQITNIKKNNSLCRKRVVFLKQSLCSL